MFDPYSLPGDEQEAIRREVHALYLQWGGEDVDRAMARDRKVLAEHERELDHVATLPFDKPYRWRIAPSVGLRAQKDLERQQKRRTELMHECLQVVLRERGHVARPEARAEAHRQHPAGDQLEQLNSFIAGAMDALHEWEQERAEASPPVTTGVA